MRTRNALKIAIGNYSLVFKNLLYKAIVFVIFGLLMGLTLSITLDKFIEQLTPVGKSLINLITEIVKGGDHASAISGVKSTFGAFKDFLADNIGSLVLMVIILVVLAVLYRFLTGVSDCTLMILVGGHMTGMAHRGYVAVMIENLKSILVYQLIDALSSIIWSLFVGLLTWGVFTLFIRTMPILVLFGCSFVIIGAISIYCTVFSQVMANVLIGDYKSVKRAFLDGIIPKKEYFGRMFAAYLTVVVVLVYLHVSVTFATFGVGEIILIPFASLLIVSMKTVDYFTINKKKYFIDYDNIVVPKELRENDESLLSDVDI